MEDSIKRNWKKWMLMCVVIAAILYGGVYYSTNYVRPTVYQPSPTAVQAGGNNVTITVIAFGGGGPPPGPDVYPQPPNRSPHPGAIVQLVNLNNTNHVFTYIADSNGNVTLHLNPGQYGAYLPRNQNSWCHYCLRREVSFDTSLNALDYNEFTVSTTGISSITLGGFDLRL